MGSQRGAECKPQFETILTLLVAMLLSWEHQLDTSCRILTHSIMSELHLFIDTSTFLTFYAYTSDDLEQLKKVTGLIRAKKLKLYVPTQVVDEFYRNREGKLAQTLESFSGGGLSKSLPRFMIDYEEAKEFEEAVKNLQQARDKIVERARKDAIERALPADAIFKNIIDTAKVIKISDAVLQLSNRRRLIGNPPGKKESVGDQINWEILLEKVDNGQDLHIVSNDGDYSSPLAKDRMHQFLEDEWLKKKSAKVHLHRQLRPFLNKHFADLKFATDIEKQIAVEKLAYSGSFSSTHSAVAELSKFVDELTWPDVEKILDAGISNNQIHWIGTDPDVNNLYRKLMVKFYDKTSIEMDDALEKLFPVIDTDNDDDDVPF